MPRYAMTPERHAAIFGAKSEEPRATGRSRLCKVCGDWHLRGHVPHNCRPAIQARQYLAAPMVAPPFEAFMTGQLDTAAYIGDRKAKREYMERNDLVEYDEGVGDRNEWVEEADTRREIIQTMREMRDTDTDYYGPDLTADRMDEGGSLEEGTEIETDGLEIVT